MVSSKKIKVIVSNLKRIRGDNIVFLQPLGLLKPFR